MSFTRYALHNGRVTVQTGFFSTVEEEVLVYRVMDIKLVQTFSNKIFGVGTIVLMTADSSTPIVNISRVKQPRKVKDFISNVVEQSRKDMGIKGKEMYGVVGNMD